MSAEGRRGRGAWRKVLYDNADYPDNFTPPECFLAARTFNQNLVVYSRAQCLAGAARVGTQISDVIIFWCCYNYIKAGDISPATVLISTFSISVLGFVLVLLLNTSVRKHAWQAIKTTLLFVMTGYPLSPILHNLTESISTDSIHLMAASSFLLHIVSTDYGVRAPLTSWQISLNASVFSSVCLASRLDSHTQAFSLLSLSVFVFLLLPSTRPLLSHLSVPWTLISSSTSLYLLSTLSLPHTWLALTVLLVVELLCPLLFHHLQEDKLTIHGPWDEAVPAHS